MIMMPVMIFYGLNYIFQGMLQSEGVFGWPAFVSVPSSLTVILYVIFLSDRFGVMGLLIATFIGLSLQALILIPPLLKKGYRFTPSFNLKDPDIIKAGKMTLPVLLGASSYQLNMFYNVTMIANYEGMVTLLTFVQNLILNMVLAFVYSITAVLYPKLTEYASTGRMDEYRKTLNTVLNTVLLLLIPITFGLICVRTPMLELITKWGKIDSSDIEKGARLIALYSVGIVGIGLKEILDRAFYALKKTLVSAINGFIIMVINISFSLVLMKYLGAYGIPLAYSIASLSGSVILLVVLGKKVGGFLDSTVSVVIKSLLSAILMSAVVVGLSEMLSGWLDESVLDRIIKLFVPTFAGALVYGVMLYIFKVEQIRSIVSGLVLKIPYRKKEN
jgi:putative peptidoglycan lipid II flippase